jgi:hypothetical protein
MPPEEGTNMTIEVSVGTEAGDDDVHLLALASGSGARGSEDLT